MAAAPTYYPELLALYSELGIELYTANSSSSLSSFCTGSTYFRYCNVLLGKRAFPLFPVRNCLNKDFLRIAGDFVYFRLVVLMLSWCCVVGFPLTGAVNPAAIMHVLTTTKVAWRTFRWAPTCIAISIRTHLSTN